LKKPVIVLLAALAALAVVAVAGCGSSSSSSTESTASLSKAEFLKKGNAICKEGNESINSEFEEFDKENNLSETAEPPKEAQEEAVEQVLIPAINRQVEEVKALGTPEGDEGELAELISAEEGVVEEAEENPLLLFESTAKQKEANKLATDYGLTVCGEEN
jgi:hypothetical protein